jgi:general secretion pathway protein A
MVLDYYNLKEQPFGVTPDPRYLYLSPTHREALASLAYGIQSGRGFMSIIAAPGMGKTTILYHLLQQLESSARVAFLCQTLCRTEDIMRAVLRDLGVEEVGDDPVQMEARLNEVLLCEAWKGRKVIVVIDEAQNLENSALELVRMLSNFETTSDKLLQIVLGGQPQLRDKLASPHLLQLRQRMSINARLQRFSREETSLYINHRLAVAGYDFTVPLFTPKAEALIAKYSRGIPRNLNNICFNALSLGWVVKQRTIEKEVIREVAKDLDLSGESVSTPDHEPAAANPSVRLVARPLSILRQTSLKVISLQKPLLESPKIRRTGVAALALLVLAPALVFGGRKCLDAISFRSIAAVRASTSTEHKQIPLTAPVEQNRTKVVTSEPPQPEPKLKQSVAETSKNQEVRSSKPAPKPGSRRQQELPKANDSDSLWAQVKKQNSNAAVELARMYLEGTGVPQNCAQARVLLMAASRKGNSQAADLLNSSAEQCR